MSLTRYLIAGATAVAFHLHANDSALSADGSPATPAREAVFQPPKKPLTAQQEADKPNPLRQSTRNSQAQYGQISGKRVRLRVAPQLDAPIIRELDKDIPVEITGESDDFYAIRPPFAVKAYVFRSYVLDGKIEGERVNIRLEPSPQATIVTQLSSGYAVSGTPSVQNPKWLEIDLPPSVRFYVSKDYIQPVDRARFQQLVNAQKPAMAVMAAPAKPVSLPVLSTPTPLSRWEIEEQNIEKKWREENPQAAPGDYKLFQASIAKTLQGQLENYAAPHSAPGDFVLCQDERIIAIVYSDQVRLIDYKNSEVKVQAIERDNHSFAYPADCIKSLDRVHE